jgi:hypothetical protein
VRKFAAWIVVFLFGGLIGTGVRGCTLFFPQTTVPSMSPNDNLRVMLRERRLDIDRNFDLLLEHVEERRSRIVFRSPDEGRPVGSERFIWSADGSRFLLLGRHFYAANAPRLSGEEQPYLMMDVSSGKIWCNASQQSEFPAFTVDDLRNVSWVGWTPD